MLLVQHLTPRGCCDYWGERRARKVEGWGDKKRGEGKRGDGVMGWMGMRQRRGKEGDVRGRGQGGGWVGWGGNGQSGAAQLTPAPSEATKLPLTPPLPSPRPRPALPPTADPNDGPATHAPPHRTAPHLRSSTRSRTVSTACKYGPECVFQLPSIDLAPVLTKSTISASPPPPPTGAPPPSEAPGVSRR